MPTSLKPDDAKALCNALLSRNSRSTSPNWCHRQCLNKTTTARPSPMIAFTVVGVPSRPWTVAPEPDVDIFFWTFVSFLPRASFLWSTAVKCSFLAPRYPVETRFGVAGGRDCVYENKLVRARMTCRPAQWRFPRVRVKRISDTGFLGNRPRQWPGTGCRGVAGIDTRSNDSDCISRSATSVDVARRLADGGHSP